MILFLLVITFLVACFYGPYLFLLNAMNHSDDWRKNILFFTVTTISSVLMVHGDAPSGDQLKGTAVVGLLGLAITMLSFFGWTIRLTAVRDHKRQESKRS
jgi:O-antigen/teichoic acid export membrane protein